MGVELYTYMINSTMGKTTDRTKLFVRFLRERGIKYIYAKETLRYAYRKEYEWKEPSAFLKDDINGNILKYLNEFFLLRLYGIFSHSFIFNMTKNGYNFWVSVEREWVWGEYINSIRWNKLHK